MAPIILTFDKPPVQLPANSASVAPLDKEVVEIVRADMVRVDTLQHHFVVTNRYNEIAVIPPDVKIVLILPCILELKLVDAEREVGNRRVDPTLSNDECVGAFIAGHRHATACCHQRVI